MSDKMRTGFPISVDFYDGEMPTAAKLRGLSRQSKNGMSLLEYALGDPWNQSGDLVLNDGGSTTVNALMIANIARFLGASKNLNPYWPYLNTINTYTHKFAGTTAIGKHEAHLFCPLTTASYSWTGTNCPTGSPKYSKALVRVSGDWYIDVSNGYIFCYNVIQGDWQVQFDILSGPVSPYTDQDTTTSYNVIPDPLTHPSYGFRGCKIAYTNNTDNSQGYIIFLPPRGPMASKLLINGPQDPYNTTNYSNASYSPDSTVSIRPWQDSSIPGQVAATNATTAPHYRYNLPKVITDNWSSGSVLPPGLVHLWDHAITQTIIEGGTFTAEVSATPRIWCFIATGPAIDTWVSNNMTACGYPSDALTQRDTHTVDYYPANGIKVITVGASVSYLLELLTKKFYNHDHYTADGIPNQMISHARLLDSFDADEGFMPSAFSNDHHPQYIHRWGSLTMRDSYYNGMFGDLLFLSQNAGNYNQNLNDDSAGIVFGNLATGPKVNYSYANNALYFTRIGLMGQGFLKVEPLGAILQPYLGLVDGIGGGAFIYHQTGTAGSVSIEDSETPALTGGQLHCNQYYPGRYYDNNSYGYSGTDEWSHCRALVIPASDFHFFTMEDISKNNGHAVYSTANIYTQVNGANDIDAFYGMLSRIPPSGWTDYAFASINLPFANYTIVNVMMSIRPYLGASAAGRFYAAIGAYGGGYYNQYSACAVGSLVSIGGDPYEIDLGNIFLGEAAGFWATTRNLFTVSSNTPASFSSNDFSINGASNEYCRPFIRFRVPGAGDNFGFYFSAATIIYRINEF